MPLLEDENKKLSFICPKCGTHRITIPVKPDPEGWDIQGEVYRDNKDVTVRPSIAHDNGMGCQSHFYITNGEIEML